MQCLTLIYITYTYDADCVRLWYLKFYSAESNFILNNKELLTVNLVLMEK